MRLIDADALAKELGITYIHDCTKCKLVDSNKRGNCSRGEDFADACWAIEIAPTINVALETLDGQGHRKVVTCKPSC